MRGQGMIAFKALSSYPLSPVRHSQPIAQSIFGRREPWFPNEKRIQTLMGIFARKIQIKSETNVKTK